MFANGRVAPREPPPPLSSIKPRKLMWKEARPSSMAISPRVRAPPHDRASRSLPSKNLRVHPCSKSSNHYVPSPRNLSKHENQAPIPKKIRKIRTRTPTQTTGTAFQNSFSKHHNHNQKDTANKAKNTGKTPGSFTRF